MKIGSVAVLINLVDSVTRFWREFVRELMAAALDTMFIFKVRSLSRAKKNLSIEESMKRKMIEGSD
jgi:hypothetical protein